mgnify:CR=1 FL=1
MKKMCPVLKVGYDIAMAIDPEMTPYETDPYCLREACAVWHLCVGRESENEPHSV